ncbi:ABC transporter permease [Neobacillus mesonae]|nr:ABC transporter permease [Neobacillus mesonae]
MTSIRLFFNRGVIIQDLKQHGWIGLLYQLLLFFFLPFVMMFEPVSGGRNLQIDSLLDVYGGMLLPLLLIFPIATVSFVFRYLHGKAASDLYHSLPITRSQLLTSHLFSALVLLLIPVWVTAAVTAIIRPYSGNHYVYELSIVWDWAVMFTFLTFFLCGLTLLLAISFGQTILQMIITYGLLLTPAWLILLGVVHGERFLFGFPGQYYERGLGTGFSVEMATPFYRFAGLTGAPFGWKELTVYLLLGAVFIVLSYVLYQRRDAAASSRTIAFPFMSFLLRLLVTLCIALVVGIYLSEITGKSDNGLLIGYAIGGILGFLIAEMVIRRTWLIFDKRAFASFLGYGILLALILYLPVTNLSGYETRVPELEDVKSVVASDSFNNIIDWDKMNRTQEKPKLSSNYFSHNSEYIEDVIGLHQEIIDKYESGKISHRQFSHNTRDLIIAYELADGKKMIRKYVLQEGELEDSLKTVMEHEEYKKQYVPKRLTDEDTIRITLSSWYTGENVNITDPADIREFKRILQKELMEMSYEDQLQMGNSWAYIDIVSNKQPYGSYQNIAWSKSFDELEAWLVKKGLADNARLSPSDISEMTITRNITNTGFLEDQNDAELELKYYDHMARLSGETKVAEESDQWDVLRYAKDFSVYADYNMDAPYLVKIQLNTGDTLVRMLDQFPEGL